MDLRRNPATARYADEYLAAVDRARALAEAYVAVHLEDDGKLVRDPGLLPASKERIDAGLVRGRLVRPGRTGRRQLGLGTGTPRALRLERRP